MPHTISILVRSRNDRPYIGNTLERLLGQQSDFPFEIVCCDDASEDGTREIISTHPEVRLIDRPEGPYFPGRTLNRMVRECRGDIVVFNNADAVPQDETYLRNLTAPLLDEHRADAVYGNQLPRPDASWLVRKDHLRAFGDGKTAAQWHFFFSLASAAAWKEDLVRYPFDETMHYSEDVEWAYRRNGRIVYAPDARVEHSHNYTDAELRRRFYGEGYADAGIFGHAPGLFQTLARAAMETCRDCRFLLFHPHGWIELPAAPRRRLIQKFYFRKGARDYLRDSTHA